MTELKFPEGFLWGAATSAFQTEGGKVLTDWSYWQTLPGRIKDGTTAEKADEAYARYEEDFRLVDAMNHNAHRFSIEWARIEPEEGHFNPEAIEHYRQELLSLKQKGIEPVVTLYHFTLPFWFFRKGGWENPESVKLFSRYVERMSAEYSGLVRFWITLNEPVIYIYYAYLVGTWPSPDEKPSFFKGLKAYRTLIQTHQRAYEILHRTAKSPVSVGLAHHMKRFLPDDPNAFLDRWVAETQEYFLNDLFLDCLRQERFLFPLGWGAARSYSGDTLDFIGLNYYTGQKSRFELKELSSFFGKPYSISRNPTYNDLDWEIYPEGLSHFAAHLHRRYKKPVLITENGIADAKDDRRPAFLLSHLKELHRAMDSGAKVLGYLHWSLLDNFEWAEGLTPRFGLVEVDYGTEKRTPRKSAELFARICRENGITAEMVEEHAPALRQNYFEKLP